MNYILYYLLLYPLSKLPFWVLFRISDGIYIVLYYVFGYRKKVVQLNLKNSFPEKTAAELKQIEKKFYKHLCDLIVEAIKNFTISAEELERHVHCINPDFCPNYYNEGRNMIIVTGHYANWEWPSTLFGVYSKHKSMGIYMPIKSKFWNEKVYKSRGKTGIVLAAPKEVPLFFEKYKNEPVKGGFIADQSPGNPEKAYWTTFLNQDTPVLFGSEKYAVEYNCVVAYGKITKVKRGYYQIEFVLITENPRDLKKGEITELHTRFNEKLIQSAPEYWLWTHKRWKHKRPVKQAQ
ncbi:MAG: hypothetical protein J0M08_13760 [Bacteroidetes bacterium]|nr:hypothetical protein [Bacteroidota bacterium]